MRRLGIGKPFVSRRSVRPDDIGECPREASCVAECRGATISSEFLMRTRSYPGDFALIANSINVEFPRFVIRSAPGSRVWFYCGGRREIVTDPPPLIFSDLAEIEPTSFDLTVTPPIGALMLRKLCAVEHSAAAPEVDLQPLGMRRVSKDDAVDVGRILDVDHYLADDFDGGGKRIVRISPSRKKRPQKLL